MRLWYCRVILWYHDIQLIFWYSDTNTMSLRDYALVRLWGHGTITLWNYDSPIVWYHETMTTLRLWLLWCYQTMILWCYEAIRLWGSATMGESMRVRKSKNRGVLKDSETVILGFYKTMDHGPWYFDAVVRRGPDIMCSCFEYVFVSYQHLYLLAVMLLLFSLLPFFIPPNRTRGPQNQEKAYLEPKKKSRKYKDMQISFPGMFVSPGNVSFFQYLGSSKSARPQSQSVKRSIRKNLSIRTFRKPW